MRFPIAFLVTAGAIKPPRETRFRLADVAQAHALLASGENIGKVILTM